MDDHKTHQQIHDEILARYASPAPAEAHPELYPLPGCLLPAHLGWGPLAVERMRQLLHQVDEILVDQEGYAGAVAVDVGAVSGVQVNLRARGADGTPVSIVSSQEEPWWFGTPKRAPYSVIPAWDLANQVTYPALRQRLAEFRDRLVVYWPRTPALTARLTAEAEALAAYLVRRGSR